MRTWWGFQASALLINIFIFCGTRAVGQDFVRAKNGILYADGVPFSFVGANAYYLQQLAAQGDTTHVREVFVTAKSRGLRCIRTWGSFDSPDSVNPATIQYKPQQYSESALRALDYVLYQADLFGIKLIIPLVNNWEEFGGMNQYVQWYAALHAKTTTLLTLSKQAREGGQAHVRIEGALGRYYHVRVADGFVHDDFYRNAEIKRWYKSYIEMVLSRVNTYNGRIYKNDPIVFAWELANEPRSSDQTGELIRSWVSEIATFMKSIDPNHLLGTGEEGFDVSQMEFHTDGQYNNQFWLFDGTTGVSFSKNIKDPNIDLASIHLYATAWKIGVSNGNRWIADHAEVSRRLGKPLILGEFGVQMNKSLIYEGWLNTLLNSAASGGLVWQLVYDSWKEVDGYSIYCSRDAPVCDVFASYAVLLHERDTAVLPLAARPSLDQNFPNPFNEVTVIRYDISLEGRVQLEIFNELGQIVVILFDGWQSRGQYANLFEARDLASGVYFYRLRTGEFVQTKKMLYLK